MNFVKDYKKIVDFLVEILEGGYDKIHKDPNDKGGITRAGISSRYWKNLDLKNMSHDDIRSFYFENYYKTPRLYLIPDNYAKIKAFMFFTVVNMYEPTLRFFQETINDFLRVYGLDTIEVDGIIGRLTINALETIMILLGDDNEIKFLLNLNTKILNYWINESGTSEHHLSGWLKRDIDQWKFIIEGGE